MTAAAVPARRSDALLLGRWIAARVRMTLRSPRALGFTFAFPLVLVTLFGAINAGVKVPLGGTEVPFAQYYTPAIGVFGLTTACYTSLIVGLATGWAGLVVAVNFAAAVAMVDRLQGIAGSFPSAGLIAMGLLLSAVGPGRYALDACIARRA